MKIYFIFIVLLLASSHDVLSQERVLELAYVDSMNYYVQDGISYQTLIHNDYTSDTLQSSSWLYITKTISAKFDTLQRKIALTNNDTARISVNFKKYDSNFNLVIEIDSVNERLTRKLTKKFINNRLTEASEFYLQSSSYRNQTDEFTKPIYKTTQYLYHKNEKLHFKTIEVVSGKHFFSSSKPDTIISYYEYNPDGKPIKSIVLEDGDTTITISEYDVNGNLVMEETKSPYFSSYFICEYDENQRAIKYIFKTNDQIEMVEENIYDEVGNLIIKTYEGKFSSSKIVNTHNANGEIIIRTTYKSK